MQNYVIRVVLALVLAVLSALANYFWLQSQKPQLDGYLAFATDVNKGQMIKTTNLKVIMLPRYANVNGVFLPSSSYGLINGIPASRDFKANELVTNSDIEISNKPPEYYVLGPFRLVSVDSHIIGSENKDKEENVSSNAVTIAAQYRKGSTGNFEFNLITRRLLQIVEQSEIQKNPEEDLRIRGIVVYQNDEQEPSQENTSTEAKAEPEKPDDPNEITFGDEKDSEKTNTMAKKQNLGLAPDEIALFVPLPDVPSIPNVILSNKSPTIGFVVSGKTISKEELN